ncbi:group II intron reverse transcriptase/maturase [Catalinimonas sp. 4WD22]|uniref:group II intron reverse transcriptase/maturase n=1 Tax=Catalinimonas locisalis TaxID=3133978 RepID=UPI003100FE5D
MIEKVISRKNIQKAYLQVRANKGSAGVDGMTVNDLPKFLKERQDKIATAVCNGKYLPQPILGVEIPKSNGKKRLLGVPTVADRVLQQAVSQVIGPKFELEFKEHSYGFRPNRNALQAVKQSQKYINEGYQHIVDIDLKSFFDEVDHCLLLQLVYRKVKCPFTMRLIRKWLRAPIQINGKLVKRRKGVPQGSPLSPILSNIMLHELDKEMEKRGLKYVRYADDFSIYTKSQSEARQVGNSIFLFLRDKLKLPINRQKSGIRKPVNFEILGYKFVPIFEKGVKGQYQLTVSNKSWKSLKRELKAITKKTIPSSLSERLAKLKQIHRGWLNYFRLGNIHARLKNLDNWLRSRIRYCIWHDWKKPERKRKNLIRLGIRYGQAYAWSRTRMGGWAVALSPILKNTVTKARLRKRGFEPMLNYYLKISQRFNEPLSTRPVR